MAAMFPTCGRSFPRHISEVTLDPFMAVSVGHGRVAPRYGIGHEQQLGTGALLLHETGGVGSVVDGDHEQYGHE